MINRTTVGLLAVFAAGLVLQLLSGQAALVGWEAALLTTSTPLLVFVAKRGQTRRRPNGE